MEARLWLAVLQVASCSFREPDLGWKEVEATGESPCCCNRTCIKHCTVDIETLRQETDVKMLMA
jgi:hypothetical protein